MDELEERQSDALTLKLEHFDGPLDLLLHLISANKVDIYDIPILEITKQYLAYLQRWDELNMEVASEFIVMAATLISIKVRKLLPNALMPDDGADDERLLAERLLMYQRFREAGAELSKHMLNPDRLILWRGTEDVREERGRETLDEMLGKVDINALYELYRRIESSKRESINPNKMPFKEVRPDRFAVHDKIVYLRAALLQAETLSFNKLRGEKEDKEEVAAYMLAMLELSHGGFLNLNQSELFGDISISRREGADLENYEEAENEGI